MNESKDFQVNIVKDGFLYYSFRRENSSVRAYTFYGDKRFRKIDESLTNLRIILDYYVRVSLFDKDGKVVLYDEFKDEVICEDVYGMASENLCDEVTKVIETAYNELGKTIDRNISKIQFVIRGGVNKMYITPSQEYGAVDIYLDYF